MMKKSQFFNIIIYLLGISLICAIFFILFKDVLSENIFWLDLVVSICVYTLLIFNIGRLFMSSDEMNKHWGGLGIRWVFINCYSLFAIGALIVMNHIFISFHIQLIAQGVLLFFLVSGFYFTMVTNEHDDRTDRQFQFEAKGINEMKTICVKFEIDISSKSTNHIIQKELNDIKEELRYLSPSIDLTALELEKQFISVISKLIIFIQDCDIQSDQEEILNRLTSCKHILKQRKNFRYN